MIRRSLWLCLILPASAWAQQPAQPPTQSDAQAPMPPAALLGRLLLTPAERAALEAARRGGAQAEATAADAGGPVSTAPAVTRLRLDGLVHREAQPALAFLNGRPVEDGGEILDYRLLAAARSVTLIASDGRRYRLQVGQSLLREEERIVDPVPPDALDNAR